jgi:hypothetical protein
VWQDQNIKLCGPKAVLQKDILCGLELCGRTRILSCVERRQCGRRLYYVVLSRVAGGSVAGGVYYVVLSRVAGPEY